jgi:small subunit ribosomal protein S17
MTEEPDNTEEPEEQPAEAQAAPAEPIETLPPKERRKRDGAAHAGEARPPRSPEERQAEREEERRRKAARRRAYRAHARQKRGERRAAEPAAEEAPALHPDLPKGNRKVRQGVVVSNKADKTITVRIDLARRHRMYGKVVRSSNTLHAHDERNDANIGDTVRLVESRPLSRTKRWRLVEILERAR